MQEMAGGERERAPGHVFGGAQLGSVEVGLGCEPAQRFAEETAPGLPGILNSGRQFPVLGLGSEVVIGCERLQGLGEGGRVGVAA